MWSVFSLEPRVTSLPCGQAVGSEASYTENGIHILHQWGPRWFPPVLITPMIKLVLYKYQLDEPNHFLYFNYVLYYVLQKTKDAKLLETRSLSVVVLFKSQLDIHPKCHWYIWIKVTQRDTYWDASTQCTDAHQQWQSFHFSCWLLGKAERWLSSYDIVGEEYILVNDLFFLEHTMWKRPVVSEIMYIFSFHNGKAKLL